MHSRSTLTLATVTLSWGLFFASDAVAQRYRLVPTETIPDHGNHHFGGLNDHGQILGYATGGRVGQYPHHPSYIWTEGQPLELLPFLDPNEWVTVAANLNNRSEAVGLSQAMPQPRGVLWRKVNNEWTVTDLSPPNAIGSSGKDLNDETVVLAWETVGFLEWDPYLWENGNITYLTPDWVYYICINNRRQVSGFRAGHAVVWENGEPRFLPHLWPGGYSSALRMNDRGDVVGFTLVDPQRDTAVAWFIGERRPVTHLGRLQSSRGGTAYDVNDGRIVVGNNLTHTHVGFVWRNHVMHNLNDLLLDGASAEWGIMRGWRINRWGQIGSDAWNSVRGQRIPVRLDPVDEGLTVWSFLPNEPGMVNTLEVIHATRGGRVVLVAGTERGEARDVPQCPGAMIELENPRLTATAVADAEGRARFNIPLPQHFAGRRAVVHAIDWSTCEASPPGFIQFQE